ncbi:U1 small nuclear ribonucleoprotein C [Penicillium ochrochloron]
MSVRKAHNSGRNHLRNVVEYYQQIGQEKAQSVIDSITSSYAAEGKAVPNPAMVPPGAFPPPFGFPVLPGGRGMPFPPFPPNASGTPPQGGFPPPLPNMPNMPPGAGNLPPPPPGGFPNFAIPPPGAAGGFPPPMPMQHGADSNIPSGPRGSDAYPPPPGGGPPPGRGDRW